MSLAEVRGPPGARLLAAARRNRFVTCLAAIALLGLVWRVVYAIAMRDLAIGSDGFRYHFGALFLADGKGFANPLTVFLQKVYVPDTGHPPGWTIVLAGATKLGLRTALEHAIFTGLIGAATIVMTGLAGRTAFGPRVGLIAAGFAASYPNVFLYEREVLSEPMAMLGVATLIWLAYRFLARPRLGLAVALGVVLGVLAMTKSDQVALGVLLIAPLILCRRSFDLRRRLTWLALAAGACVIVMAPWSIYLSERFDRPAVLSGAVGSTMAAGNCAATYEGELLGWYKFGCTLTLGRPGDRAEDDPIAADAKARDRALTFMSEHRSRVPVVMAARVGRSFSVYRPFQQMNQEFGGGTRWVATWGMFAYWVMFPFAVAGVVIARRRRVPVYPLLVFPVVVLLAVLPTIGAVRYRAPAEIPLVILTAVGIEAAFAAWMGRRRARREPAPAGVSEHP